MLGFAENQCVAFYNYSCIIIMPLKCKKKIKHINLLRHCERSLLRKLQNVIERNYSVSEKIYWNVSLGRPENT